MVRMYGLVDVNAEQRSSTAGCVAQGSSERHSAHRPAKLRKILQSLECGVVEQIALAHDPADPLLKHALRQVFAQTAPARRIAQEPGEGGADVIQHEVDAIAFRR